MMKKLEIKNLLEGVSSVDPKVKYRSLRNLKVISEKIPLKLYPEIGFFIKLLKHENDILKWNAMDIIANLAAVDYKNKIDKIFKEFYGLLHSGRLVTAAHVVDNSWKIVWAKPKLCSKITTELLKVTAVPLPTKECKNILIGKVMVSCGKYLDKADDKDKRKIIDFVEKYKNNSRNSTQIKAQHFLRDH